ncbi:MAG: NGG1p interacting factor NIF3 [Candidatus Omnitrophota bacterium]|nr:NGG1p interacting factor NIF3 [Candidatus Omnitrophota bacterium]
MKLKDMYEMVVAKGLKEDLRPKSLIDKASKEEKKSYAKKEGADRTLFDKENLKHPFGDTRILNGTGNEEIKTVMVGIDIGGAELLLADRLREKGIKIDLVVSHHPSGRALAQLHKVMSLQPDIWERYGISREVAQGMMKERMEEVSRGVASSNHTRERDAARLLKIPFMCTHTPADNCVTGYLQKIFDKEKPGKLRNVLAILKRIPEYRYSMKENAGPFILIGEDKSDAGKVFVDMTGGTSGPDKIFSRLSQSGVKTIVGMHCKETSYKVAKSEFINYVIAGHISSDTLGMNILFDGIEKKEKLNFVECSGFKRVRR